jgi:uncharacterized protein (TIGR01777 family)
MRVGVTGSSGFIGTALVAALHQRGDQVVRFVRPGATASVEPAVRWDPTRGLVDDGDLRSVGGFDAVVNLAGAGVGDHRWTEARKSLVLQSRIATTELLVEALGSLPDGTAYLASGSAIGIYGARRLEPVDEHASLGNDFLAQVCQSWEGAALALAAKGAKVSLLRTGIVMSARGGVLKRQLPLFRYGLGGRLANGQQVLSALSLVDEVRAILWAIDHQIDGPINLAAVAVTNAEFTTAVARALHRPALARVPAVALRIILGSELVTGAVLASQRVEARVLRESGFTFAQSDLTSIVESALSRVQE